MINFPTPNRVINFLIKTRWKYWIFPFACSLPYLYSIFWLVGRGQSWIAQILLAPIFMTLVLASLTLLLAKLEFRR